MGKRRKYQDVRARMCKSCRHLLLFSISIDYFGFYLIRGVGSIYNIRLIQLPLRQCINRVSCAGAAQVSAKI
jgi:hypothetical protein